MTNQIVWKRWDQGPVAAGAIRAPNSMFRICAYHIDWDERPSCYVDVATLAEAQRICAGFSNSQCPFNVDYAWTYDDTGKRVTDPPW